MTTTKFKDGYWVAMAPLERFLTVSAKDVGTWMSMSLRLALNYPCGIIVFDLEHRGQFFACSELLAILTGSSSHCWSFVEPELEIPDDRMKKLEESLNGVEVNALRQYFGILGWPEVNSTPDFQRQIC